MAERFLSDFPPITTETWREQIQTDLKGADFDKRLVATNLDGIKVQPFHRAEDVEKYRTSPLKTRVGWKFREEIRELDLKTANDHLHRALDRGADDVSILTYPTGPTPKSLNDLAVLLDGVWDRGAKIHWQCGPLSGHMLAMLLSEARARDIDLATLEGSTDLDPILDRCSGWIDADLESWEAETITRIQEITSYLPKYGLLCIRGAFLEKAGASIGQELAWTLALLHEYLVAIRAALDAGTLKIPGCEDPVAALSEIVRRSEIRLGVGTSYFFEISKIRAMRQLLLSLLASHGIHDVMPAIHATSTSSNKTVYDPTNNLLRGTVEAMAMAVGGADSITVAAYDQGYHAPDEFSEHLARNTHTLLGAEAHLNVVADPLAGSYTVEWLTQAYVARAWEILNGIEDKGGFIQAWERGEIASELERVRTARSHQVRTRRRLIVGTTAFGNPLERRLPEIEDRPTAYVVRPILGSIDDTLDAFVEAGHLDHWMTNVKVPSTALDPYRVSWPYEHLRLRTERHGRIPVVHLVLFGDLKMRHARAAFCQSLLSAGGYQVSESVVKSLAEVRTDGVDLCVLCSADDAYIPALEANRPSVSVFVAGYPEADLEHLRSLGVEGFLHLRQPIDEILNDLHDRFGIPEYGPAAQEVSV
jgi:methylmalonyl-CoA mutase